VTTATRWEALPDVPTVGEFVADYEASSVWGLGAPRNTPAEIVDKLTSSTKRSTKPLLIPRSRRGSPTWAAPCFPARQTEFVVERRVDRVGRSDHKQRTTVSWRTHLSGDIGAGPLTVLNDDWLP
jgi:hypothetical protein